MYEMAKRCARLWRDTGSEYWRKQMLRYLKMDNNGCACDECVFELLELAK